MELHKGVLSTVPQVLAHYNSMVHRTSNTTLCRCGVPETHSDTIHRVELSSMQDDLIKITLTGLHHRTLPATKKSKGEGKRNHQCEHQGNTCNHY
eukprot:2382663-Amphidinium_carterae.1